MEELIYGKTNKNFDFSKYNAFSYAPILFVQSKIYNTGLLEASKKIELNFVYYSLLIRLLKERNKNSEIVELFQNMTNTLNQVFNLFVSENEDFNAYMQKIKNKSNFELEYDFEILFLPANSFTLKDLNEHKNNYNYVFFIGDSITGEKYSKNYSTEEFYDLLIKSLSSKLSEVSKDCETFPDINYNIMYMSSRTNLPIEVIYWYNSIISNLKYFLNSTSVHKNKLMPFDTCIKNFENKFYLENIHPIQKRPS